MDDTYQDSDQELKNLHGALAEWIAESQNKKYVGRCEQDARPERQLGKEDVERDRRSQELGQVGSNDSYLREYV